MNKKKAIKVLSATAVAASAFVATAPAQAAPANNDAASLVQKAKQAGTVLKWAISTEGSADGTTRPWAEYNAAKVARDAAVAAVNKLPAAQKAGYLADIEQNVTLHINRTMAYIDAITAGEKIKEKREVLEALIAQNLINDQTEAAYHELSKEIRKQAILLDRVYGKSTRDEIRAAYKQAAEKVRDSVKYEVTVKIELDLAKKALAANNVADAEKHLAEAAKYMTEVKNAAMKAELAKTLDEVEAQMTPKVQSVSAINATQVEVSFNKAVDAKSLFADGVSGTFKSGVVSIRSIDSVTDGTLTGELSQDGKVLTVTSTQLFEKRYDVVVDKVKTTTGTDVEKFSKIISIDKDVTAPSILGTERITSTQVKVKFSEPMASAGSVTFKLSDGTTVSNITGHGSLVDGGKTIVLDLSNASVPVNKDITATFIGAADKAGNLLNPNPATVTFQKGDKDGVAPTVSSVTQTGASTFEIIFSEAIVGKPTVSIDKVAVNAKSVVIDSKDATKVIVTAPSVLDGDKIITITGAVDGSGEAQAATNRVVKFVKDAVAPVLVSSAVVVDTTNMAEYLEFTFDKNVNLSSATVDVTGGSYVKNHVTTTLADSDITKKTVNYKDVNNKKVVRVELKTLLGNKSVEGAQYSVNLAFSGVKSEAGEAITTGTATFTRGQDGTLPNTDVVALASSNAIVQSTNDNSVIEVTFDKAVDAATATNTLNYIVGGAVVESATVNAKDLTKVTLKLKADSNTFTGVRNVTVQNIKAAGSTVAMTTTTKAVDLKENVAPTVTAQLQADLKTIKLTFSENVYQTAEGIVDFGVLVGTDAYKVEDVALEKDSGLTTDVNKSVNTINLVLPTTVTAAQLSKGLSLKALTTLDITDVAGNKLSVPANITISNN